MSTTTKLERALPPSHPGDFIRTEIVDAHKLTVTAAAEKLGVGRPALSHLLNGHSDLTGAMALRIEKVFGVQMDTLMRMQTAYNIWRTRQHADEILVAERVEQIAVSLPKVKSLHKTK